LVQSAGKDLQCMHMSERREANCCPLQRHTLSNSRGYFAYRVFGRGH